MVKYCDEQEYKSRKQVAEAYPSAVKIVRVCGGWMVFEVWADYETWRRQK